MIATIAMIAVVVAIVENNSSAIVAIYGFHMIAAIATIALRKWMKVEGTCAVWHIRNIRQIQHGGCE